MHTNVEIGSMIFFKLVFIQSITYIIRIRIINKYEIVRLKIGTTDYRALPIEGRGHDIIQIG